MTGEPIRDSTPNNVVERTGFIALHPIFVDGVAPHPESIVNTSLAVYGESSSKRQHLGV
jgi:hypothetical protein